MKHYVNRYTHSFLQTRIENSSLKTYLFSIGKHKIYDRLKERKQFIGSVVTARDITDLKKSQKEINKSNVLPLCWIFLKELITDSTLSSLSFASLVKLNKI